MGGPLHLYLGTLRSKTRSIGRFVHVDAHVANVVPRRALLSRWKRDRDAEAALSAVRKRDVASEAADQTASNRESETRALNRLAV
jgi:hypothetical protein